MIWHIIILISTALSKFSSNIRVSLLGLLLTFIGVGCLFIKQNLWFAGLGIIAIYTGVIVILFTLVTFLYNITLTKTSKDWVSKVAVLWGIGLVIIIYLIYNDYFTMLPYGSESPSASNVINIVAASHVKNKYPSVLGFAFLYQHPGITIVISMSRRLAIFIAASVYSALNRSKSIPKLKQEDSIENGKSKKTHVNSGTEKDSKKDPNSSE